jgi:hypothetical protein
MTESKNKREEEIKNEPNPVNTNNESEKANSQKQCKSCHQMIHISATVCQHCHQSQNRWMKFFQTTPLLVPLVLAALAALNLYEAHQKNVDATTALETARAAARDASDAKEIAKTAATDANKALVQVISITAEANGLKTFMAAQAGDRTAYDQLGKWATDACYPFRAQSERAYFKIMDEHSQAIYERGFPINWKKGTDPNTLTFEQLKQNFWSADLNQDPYTRRTLLEYIWQRNDFDIILRLDFLIDVIKADKDLMVCEYAGRYFTQGTETNIKPLAFDRLIQWWADYRIKFEEKPDPNK